MLKLIGFFSFFSQVLFSLIFCTLFIFASISFFFLRMSSACSVMAASLFGFPSPDPDRPLDHILTLMSSFKSLNYLQEYDWSNLFIKDSTHYFTINNL